MAKITKEHYKVISSGGMKNVSLECVSLELLPGAKEKIQDLSSRFIEATELLNRNVFGVVYRQGNFTIANIFFADLGMMTTGVSKKCPKDDSSDFVGGVIAVHRALDNYFGVPGFTERQQQKKKKKHDLSVAKKEGSQ